MHPCLRCKGAQASTSKYKQAQASTREHKKAQNKHKQVDKGEVRAANHPFKRPGPHMMKQHMYRQKMGQRAGLLAEAHGVPPQEDQGQEGGFPDSRRFPGRSAGRHRGSSAGGGRGTARGSAKGLSISFAGVSRFLEFGLHHPSLQSLHLMCVFSPRFSDLRKYFHLVTQSEELRGSGGRFGGLIRERHRSPNTILHPFEERSSEVQLLGNCASPSRPGYGF